MKPVCLFPGDGLHRIHAYLTGLPCHPGDSRIFYNSCQDGQVRLCELAL